MGGASDIGTIMSPPIYTDTIQTEDEDASGSVVWHDAEDDGDQDHVTTEATPSAQEGQRY